MHNLLVNHINMCNLCWELSPREPKNLGWDLQFLNDSIVVRYFKQDNVVFFFIYRGLENNTLHEINVKQQVNLTHSELEKELKRLFETHDK